MRTDAVLVRYNEIGIKGQNRPYFEKVLVNNIKDCLRRNNVGFSDVKREYGRVVMATNDKNSINYIKNVFGIASISPAMKIKADIETMKNTAMLIAKENDIENKTFRISCTRLNKKFPIESQKVNMIVGEYIFENNKTKVDLKNPDINIGIEVIGDEAFLYTQTIQGFGGLPLGTQGKVFALMEDERSILAAWSIMRRGVVVVPVAFSDFDIKVLNNYDYGHDAKLMKIKSLKELENIDKNIKGIVVNQTLKTFKKIDTELVIFRPLLGFSEEEMKDTLEKIKQ